jgi:hypothetical protein
MTRRWALNLLLLILVAALATLVRRELEVSERISTLTGLEPDQIAEIVLDRPGDPEIRLARTSQGWRMQAPYEVAAEAGRVDQLVRIAATMVHRTLPNAPDAEGLGTDPGRVRLTLDGLGLRFGDTDPLGERRYVAVGDRVHLIDDGFQHHLLAAAEDYVARRLLPPGFRPGAGTLEGEPLPASALEELGGLTAERVEPLGEEISGRLLSLEPAGGEGSGLRFLISEDARVWTRLDLRLRYLLGEPPFWALGEEAPAPAGEADTLPAPTE